MVIKVPREKVDAVQAVFPGDFIPLPAGGYVCKIVNAEFGTSKSGNDMLILSIDIAEGEFTNYFSESFKRFNSEKWPNVAMYRPMLWGEDGENISRYFKGFCKLVELSNPGFVAHTGEGYDDKAFVGKHIGFVFGDEEYPKQDGTTAVRAAIRTPKSIADIREGKFKIPPLKKLDAGKAGARLTSQYGAPPSSPNTGAVVSAGSESLEDTPF